MFNPWRPIRKARSIRRPSVRRGIRLEVECLEDRLVPSWAGVPPSTITVPSGAVGVSLNLAGDATGNAAITSNEVDYYTFVAPVSGSYRFGATTPSSNLDTVLGVFNRSGQRIAYNDDISSTNYDSQLTVNLTAGSRYYFGITNYTGTPGGSYTWLVDGPSRDDGYEENDDLSAAYNLGTLSARRTISGLVMADAGDWFKFTMNGTGTSSHYVQINFTHSSGDLDLALYNSAGTRIGISQGVTNSERISLSGLGSGTYYVRAYGYNGAFNPSYTLDINPAVSTTPPPPTGGFQIQLSFSGLTTSQINVFNQAAARWAQVITGDLPDATYNGQAVDDVLIAARVVSIDGVGGVLGQAGPDYVRSGTYLPIHGVMEFDSADMAWLEQNGQLYNVILHEMGHVLGIGTIWSYRGLVTGAGTANSMFVGANAVREYNAIFGVNATGVPLETSMGPGSNDSHWRESLFGNELMSPVLNSNSANPLSRITIGSLADLGYVVNMNAADAYTRPASVTTTSSTASTTGGAALVAQVLAGGGLGENRLDAAFRHLANYRDGGPTYQPQTASRPLLAKVARHEQYQPTQGSLPSLGTSEIATGEALPETTDWEWVDELFVQEA